MSEEKYLPHTEKGEITELNSNYAKIKLNEQIICWPLSSLPENTKVGDHVYLTLANKENYQKQKSQIAKLMLNELIGNQL